jgi:TonB-linked SusC/RagA family outer membrane protein
MRKILLSLAFTFVIAVIGFGQKTITGTIVDADDLPLIGVNILIKENPDVGTLTDFDGKYSITVRRGQTLTFSYLGFKTQEIIVDNGNVIDVTLLQDAQIIDEIVVVGYGTSKKSDLTGSVSSISGEELRNSLTTNIDQALQGRIAGVQVTQNSGQPGGAASIRIRGANSLSLSNEPLYVVDGIPFQGDGAATAGFDWAGGENGQNRVNPLSTINPADIVSIDVLKDASATAIYGSRGANGVVIITTKRGKKGESRIAYNSWFGMQVIPQTLDMMDLRQYADYQAQIASDLGRQLNQRYLDPSLLGPGTDWQDEIFRQAGSQSHQLSISGGTDKTRYSISGGYFDQDGVVIGSNFDRISSRLNIDSEVKDWFSIGGSLGFAKTGERITLNSGGGGVIMSSLSMQPDVAVRDINGNYAGPNSGEVTASYNPVASALLRNNTLDRQRLMSNVYGNITLFEGLEFRSEIGFDNNHSINHAFHPTYKWGAIENRENRLRQREENSFFWVNKNYLTYNTNITENQKITLLLGQEAQKSTYDGSDITVLNLPSNDIQIISQGEFFGTNPGAWRGASSLLSYYTRLNYNLSERYLLTFTYRADASSNFGPGNKWGYFPSGSLAWRISEEGFLKESSFINNLKLRVGYGNSGNQSIPAGLFSSLMQNVTTPFGLGFRPARVANPELGWETTAQLNVGIDLTILKNKVDITFDVYNKQTSDMLLQTTVPRYLGGTGYNDIASPFINVGKMENKGFDISINTHQIRTNNFSWDTDLTFSMNRNKILELDDEDKIYWQNLYWYSEFQTATTTRVGQPIGQFWGYVTDGLFIDQQDILNHAVQVSDGVISDANPFGQNLVDKRGGVWIGDIKFKDINNDGVINENDQTFVGDPNPDFTFGLNNSFSWGAFDATVYINGSYGGDILNYSRRVIEGMTNVFGNQSAAVFDRARYELLDANGSDLDPSNVILANPGTNIPRPTTNDVNRNTRMSDRWIEDGSYLRIQNVKLGYSLPVSLTRKARIERLKVYFNIQNLATITNYSGYDPEIGAFNQSPLLQNVDIGRYPSPRMYTVGFDVEF